MQSRRPVAGFAATFIAVFGLLALATPLSAADKEQLIYSFCSLYGCTDGSGPESALIFDKAGNLYSTTGGGGFDENGTVFELTPGGRGEWSESVLFKFADGDKGGYQPADGLTLDSEGNLYGTTAWGGAYGDGGDGVVFELSPGANGEWTENVLFSFNGTDGWYPTAGVIFDKAGNLYGTTFLGGGGTECNQGCGVVFELSLGANGQWTETVLHTFNRTDGQGPRGGLILDDAGNLYGMTAGGGPYLAGTVFELSPGKDRLWNYKTLHFFNVKDGRAPYGNLVFDKAGNLYGTTLNGGAGTGCPTNCGVVFELSPAAHGKWTEKVLHNFVNNGIDGWYSQAGLTFDEKGSLYGTTAYGGSVPGCTGQFGLCGVVFKLTPNGKGGWKEKVLHSFNSNGDGAGPYGGLIFDKAGNIYGTTAAGGGNVYGGAVFEITP